MLIYIVIRFKDVKFGVSAVLALCHDVAMVFVLYILLRLSVGNTCIACMLTIFGYSINATIIVFDRIRENLKLHPKGDRQQLFNASINETLARTINTSTSTLIVLLCIFILGGDSIRSFSFAMILGVVFGTLSSIFIASPLAYLVLGRKIKAEPAEEVAAVEAK